MSSIRLHFGIFVLLVMCVNIAGCGKAKDLGNAEHLTIGNFENYGASESFIISNSHPFKSGNIVFWYEQDGIDKCIYSIQIEGNAKKKVTTSCTALTEGDIRYIAAWADSVPKRASIAKVIN